MITTMSPETAPAEPTTKPAEPDTEQPTITPHTNPDKDPWNPGTGPIVKPGPKA